MLQRRRACALSEHARANDRCADAQARPPLSGAPWHRPQAAPSRPQAWQRANWGRAFFLWPQTVFPAPAPACADLADLAGLGGSGDLGGPSDARAVAAETGVAAWRERQLPQPGRWAAHRYWTRQGPQRRAPPWSFPAQARALPRLV